ncbi:MAG TPA: disulfide bond formation protein B [Burkholderiales bacterium]|nr:disulfide bond formation protein B [Burkholderiales bacterium]
MKVRLIFLAVFLACLGLLAFGLYLQHVEHLEPCPLCILQRLAFIAAGLTALVAAIHNPHGIGKAVYAVTLSLCAGLGAGVAGRHVWLQSFPPAKSVACGPDLEYLLDAFPLSKALPMIFKGSGDCGKIAWSFLGLSIPGWALLWFILFVLAGLAVLFRGLRPEQ